MGRPTSVKDVDQHEAVCKIAAFLKKSGKVKVPEWVDIVKLGKSKELAPIDPDWYYVRAASIARRLYFRSAGVGSYRTVYGANQRRGCAPNRFAKASGAVIRKALQTLEGLKWVEKNPTGGRRLTKQGRKDLDRIASQMRNEKAE